MNVRYQLILWYMHAIIHADSIHQCRRERSPSKELQTGVYVVNLNGINIMYINQRLIIDNKKKTNTVSSVMTVNKLT